MTNQQLPFVETPALKPKYVCWIDIMGMKSMLRRSVTTASIMICRFQKLLNNIAQSNDNIKIYPIMDGAYITTSDKSKLESFLNEIYNNVANNFINEKKFYNKFIIKSCVAFGLIGDGSEISDNEFPSKNSLVFGLPIIQAFEDENKAPPFGIFIHQSARALSCPENETYSPFTTRWHIWFKPNDTIQQTLKVSLQAYYSTAEKLTHALPYPAEELKKHSDMAMQYLEYWDTLALPSTEPNTE